jgi:ABC-2 type transport system permease protein
VDSTGSRRPFDTNASFSRFQLLKWSVRREIWENRSIYLAPLIMAAVVLFSCLIMTAGLPKRIRQATPAKLHATIVMPASIAPAPVMFTTFLVACLYCIDALYSERRDRSLLFWKSLPVSDEIVVVSKFAIPLVVLPVIGYVLGELLHITLMGFGGIVLAANRMSPMMLWSELPLPDGFFVAAYGLTAHALWFAPIYGWLMLVSGWARRAPLLWAILPFAAIAIFEQMTVGTHHFVLFLKYRMNGAMRTAFTPSATRSGKFERLSDLDPATFLATPGLWLGLLFAAACLYAAIRLRRNREPA